MYQCTPICQEDSPFFQDLSSHGIVVYLLSQGFLLRPSKLMGSPYKRIKYTQSQCMVLFPRVEMDSIFLKNVKFNKIIFILTICYLFMIYWQEIKSLWKAIHKNILILFLGFKLEKKRSWNLIFQILKM